MAQRLELLELSGTEQRYPSELSGGMRKRVALARALMLDPAIVVYDEPTSGLDPITSRLVDDLIIETNRRFNVTSVVITHDRLETSWNCRPMVGSAVATMVWSRAARNVVSIRLKRMARTSPGVSGAGGAIGGASPISMTSAGCSDSSAGIGSDNAFWSAG